LLARSFFNKIRLKSEKKLQGISNGAMEKLVQYHWPGNIRELKSAFEFAFVSCGEGMIQPGDLPQAVLGNEEKPETSEEKPMDLNEIKKQRLVQALRKAGGNKSETARILGISRTSVWNQMRRFGL
jgi:transcriptional regulator of acetoin/glycerol metabolism